MGFILADRRVPGYCDGFGWHYVSHMLWVHCSVRVGSFSPSCGCHSHQYLLILFDKKPMASTLPPALAATLAIILALAWLLARHLRRKKKLPEVKLSQLAPTPLRLQPQFPVCPVGCFVFSGPLLSCSVAPFFPFFFGGCPTKQVFPKKGSFFFQGH